MLGVVRRLRAEDYSRRIRVLSNDELGILGDAGNQMIEGLKERKYIRDTFGRYVTPEIRDQILAGKIPTKGEIREATMVFVDLRGFTPYVEENTPDEVITSMRDYFTAMEAVIRKHRGLVLQFVGDEIEAVFGVPLTDEQHADRAVRSALDIRRALDSLNEDRTRKGKAAFRHGVGVHTGMVLAGNTGSESRLSYALIGEAVNLASRIQDLTKKIGYDILVSEDTASRLRDRYELEKCGPERVKGFSKPVTVFKLLGQEKKT
jgi:class 3 adenylate cyclase